MAIIFHRFGRCMVAGAKKFSNSVPAIMQGAKNFPIWLVQPCREQKSFRFSLLQVAGSQKNSDLLSCNLQGAKNNPFNSPAHCRWQILF